MEELRQRNRSGLPGCPKMMNMDRIQEYKHGSVTLTGDSTGSTLFYVYHDGVCLLASQDVVALLGAVRAKGLPLTVASDAICYPLTQGVVPLPRSMFAEVRVLGIGDVLDCRCEAKGWDLQHRVDFPYFAAASRQDQHSDPELLMSLLTGAVSRQLDGHDAVALMLSSGKDSVALAAALAQLGRKDVRCFTFVANTDQDEDGYARTLCRRLGLSHERIEIPVQCSMDADILTNVFRDAPLPCVDDCQIPYVYALHAAGGVDAVLDGSGNDVYMGHVPSRNDRWRDRLRLQSRTFARILERCMPYGTKLDQLLRDPVEHCFVQGFFRRHEVERIFPAAAMDDAWKVPLLDAYERLDTFDFRALVRGRHYDQGSCALKAFVACEAAGVRCLLPWCDADIIDYYFNLPESARFDRYSYTNKVLLREMLRKEIDYPDAELGKRYFQFDRIAFYLTNRKLVEDEILGCSMWDRRASEKILVKLYRRLSRNSRVGVALNAWFLLSGWLNHNRWMNP